MMNIEGFIELSEGIYGEYKPNLKTMVIKFLEKSINPEMIGKVYVYVINNHKVKFGVPCIATIRECIKKSADDKNYVSPYMSKSCGSNHPSYMEDYLNGDEELKPIGSLVDELAKKVKHD